VAAIGTLPLPVMHRSIVIHMERRDGRRQLTRLDTDDADTKADLNTAYRMMVSWARDAELASDPPLPAQLRDRQADNWRPLIAIADAFGADWAMRRGRRRPPHCLPEEAVLVGPVCGVKFPSTAGKSGFSPF
jgi:hypothetical protein